MSLTEDPGADPKALGPVNDIASGQLAAELVEALVHLLIEKGVLTKNDALSIVQTVAQVQQGRVVDSEVPAVLTGELQMLRRMYDSFEAIADRPGMSLPEVNNVHQLRPPIYGDDLEFPGDD